MEESKSSRLVYRFKRNDRRVHLENARLTIRKLRTIV